MAAYVKLQRSIWMDPDFRTLSATAQRLYMLLISAPDMSIAGVAPVTVGRWASLSSNTTHDSIRADLIELEMAKFIVIDTTTEELLVRSYIVHDEAYRSPNGVTALKKARDSVLSPQIRSHIVKALERVGVTEKAPSVAPTQAPSVAPTSPQQPAASSHSLNQQPAAEGVREEAIRQFIEHRTRETRPRSAAGFKKKLSQDIPVEFGPQLDAVLASKPDVTAADLLYDVFDLTELDVYRLTGKAKGA